MRTRSVRLFVFSVACSALALSITSPLAATWSIVAADSTTGEVAIGSATCVTGFDLKALSPVLLVGLGGGAAQSFVDGSGQRRNIIRQGLLDGLSSDAILVQLQALPGTANHQHGIADTGGDASTGTGVTNGAHASGVTGQIGSVHYAIQGNVLTGSPVVTEAASAFETTVGDLPEKLMAAMEAARAFGGDGRCSCSPANPTGCGAPPPSFTKSADIGYMLVARTGDTDDANCTSGGCADGDYFMSFNVANQSAGDPDAVVQLRGLFDTWRAGLVGRPDATQTTVSFVPTEGNDVDMTIEPRDWQGTPLAAPITSVTVEHAPDSAGISMIGPVVSVGDGTYTVALSFGAGSGTDRFLLTLDDGLRPVVVPPSNASLPIDQSIFADGFEGGDVSAWTFAVP